MKPEVFYPRVLEIFAEAADERHRRMTPLHDEVMGWYLGRVQAITAEAAAGRCAEGRTLAQVVGHIMEWDRYMVVSAGEMLAGVEWPGIMAMERYVETDGQSSGYSSLDEFNARQAAKHASWPWPRIQALALDISRVVHDLFTSPGLLTARKLEATRPYVWRVPGGSRLTIPAGWFVWMVTLEHEGVEHEPELEREGGS